MSEDITVSDVRAMLREELAQILYTDVESIDDDVPFEELGLDSVLSVELAAAINARYGTQEKIEVMYQHPTVGVLAEYVAAVAGQAAAAKSL